MSESREIRLRRLHMRSIRRGTKEMDILLMRFAKARLAQLGEAELDHYEALLGENDQDLYQWVSGQAVPPKALAPLIQEIRQASVCGQAGV